MSELSRGGRGYRICKRTNGQPSQRRGGESKDQVKFNVHTRRVHHFLVIPISGSVAIDEYANKAERIEQQRHQHTLKNCAQSVETKNHKRSEEHTSELQSLMRRSYAVF